MSKSMRDAKGRPLVAVTGMGIVTSLGQGQAENWSAVTAGRSGIHAITRFPKEGLRTKIAGTIAATYAVAIGGLLLLYPACRWYRSVKAAHPESFLKYI